MSVNFGSFSRVKKQPVIEEVAKLKLIIKNSNYESNTLYYFNNKTDWDYAKNNRRDGDLVAVIDGLMILAPEYYIKLGKN